MTPWPAPKLPDKSHRLNVDLSIADVNLIRSVIPHYGLLSTFTQTIFHDLANFIRTNGYTYADTDTVIAYFRYRADSQFTGHTYPRIGRERPEIVDNNAAVSAQLKSSLDETTPNRQRDEKGSKVKRKAKR